MDPKPPRAALKTRSDVGTIAALFAAVFIVWAAVGLAPFFLESCFKVPLTNEKLERTGTFGDTFGAVNSLFSALGVAGVAYALILQYREQRDAREESLKSRAHDAELAMMAAMINGYAALLPVAMQAHKDILEAIRKTSYVLPSHREIDENTANSLGNVVDKHKREIERLLELAERKMEIATTE